jgi:hypothetical protein
VSSSNAPLSQPAASALIAVCLQLPLGTESHVTTQLSFVDRQAAVEDLWMTSLLEAQKKRIQELEAQLEAHKANVKKLETENKRVRECEQEDLWVLILVSPEIDENYIPPEILSLRRSLSSDLCLFLASC